MYVIQNNATVYQVLSEWGKHFWELLWLISCIIMFMLVSCSVTSSLLPPLGSFWMPFFLHEANSLYPDSKAPNISFQIKEFNTLQNYIIMQLYTEKLSAHFWFFTGYSEIEYSPNLSWLLLLYYYTCGILHWKKQIASFW